MYITRLASNEIFSPSNKIHREVGRAKDLSTSLYLHPRQHGGLTHAVRTRREIGLSICFLVLPQYCELTIRGCLRQVCLQCYPYLNQISFNPADISVRGVTLLIRF